MNLVTVIVIIVIVIIVFLGVIFATEIRKGNAKPIDPDNCDVSTNSVPSIAGIGCCYRGEQVTQFKFYPPFNAVLGPNPVYWVQACSGFCKDDKVSTNKLSCAEGSSEEYEKCIALAKPRNCKGLAMPVAADGTDLFYINFATNESCTCSGNCDGSSDCT